jgi:hypothetical protein
MQQFKQYTVEQASYYFNEQSNKRITGAENRGLIISGVLPLAVCGIAQQPEAYCSNQCQYDDNRHQ